MAKLKYKTQAVNTVIDPSGGYICQPHTAVPRDRVKPKVAALTL